ncbi:GIY-YIG nuclease family protein [Candidatus Dojkabacteria bacterium]|uniref:GIY-YIG nuclease family protein n=1 Tax=Candidatus Dojkabacteria bacterium TaxID=2099670 RepID=A0A955RHL6_9BACT|nr:GIY-YIG nuclease family protein [Candidatus Dojkabacteria bacterium]
MNYYVYMITNQKNKTLYIGVTNNIERRIFEHKTQQMKGFSSKYHLDKLVYYEIHNRPYDAIVREKQLKKWNRSWKERIINELNPNWEDLSNLF